MKHSGKIQEIRLPSLSGRKRSSKRRTRSEPRARANAIRWLEARRWEAYSDAELTGVLAAIDAVQIGLRDQ